MGNEIEANAAIVAELRGLQRAAAAAEYQTCRCCGEGLDDPECACERGSCPGCDADGARP